MKILWFTNTPCLAKQREDASTYTGGWLDSLEAEIVKHEEIELHICYYSSIFQEDFYFAKTYFHPIRMNRKYKYLKLLSRIKYDKICLSKMYEIIDYVKPDIIHIHGTEENWGLIQEKIKIPIAISIQGLLLPYYNKYYSGLSKFDVIKHDPLKYKLTIIRSEMMSDKIFKYNAIREEKFLRLSKFIIGRTNWDKNITSVFAQKSKYYTCNEILRPEFYQNEYWDKDKYSQPYKIVTTMSGGMYKGLEDVIKTIDILQKCYINNFNWTIIGINEEDRYALLTMKCLKIKEMPSCLKFAGRKNATEIKDILLQSDLYCQVSHIENSPNSLCEAMILGLPIVTSYAGGTPSMLNDEDGILVQDGDPYAYAGAIKKLMDDYDLATSYGKSARKRALKRHNTQDITTNLLNIYKNIINKQ